MSAQTRTAERIASRASERTVERDEERQLERPQASHMSSESLLPPINPGRVPAGYVMEWKRRSVLGAHDKRNMVQVARYHWTPVPHEMQPHMLGQFGHDGDEIEIGGQVLMMRPAYLNDDANQENRAETQNVLASQLQQIRDSQEAVGAKHAYMKSQRVQVPGDPN